MLVATLANQPGETGAATKNGLGDAVLAPATPLSKGVFIGFSHKIRGRVSSPLSLRSKQARVDKANPM